MNRTELDDILQELSKAPDDQIEENQAKAIGQLVGKKPFEIVMGLQKVLDDCACYSLASDFAMNMLYITWEESKKVK